MNGSFRTAITSLCAALALAIPATASATNGAASGLRVAEDTNADFSNIDLTAQRNHVVILQPWQTDKLHQIKAANPDTIVLCHKNFGGASSSMNGPTGLYSSGVSYQEAASQHPEWFLKDSSGNRITFNGYSNLYAMDVGNSSYQRAWATNVIHELQQTGFDGVLMDNVDTTLQYDFSGSVKYQNDSDWRSAMGSALAYVGPQLQSAGRLAIANIGSWGGNPSVGRSWLQYLSGGMDEMFAKWGNTAGDGYAPDYRWQAALDSLKYAQQHGKEFLAVTHSSRTDQKAAVYGWATVLLAGDGQADYTMAPDYTNETWFPEYGYDIGNPTGSESTDADGVHRRRFSNGIVLVNPTTEQHSASLPGKYSGSGMTDVSSVTLHPNSAYVLQRTGDGGDGGSGDGGGSPLAKLTPHGKRLKHGKIVARGKVTARGTGKGLAAGSGRVTVWAKRIGGSARKRLTPIRHHGRFRAKIHIHRAGKYRLYAQYASGRKHRWPAPIRVHRRQLHHHRR